MSEIKPQDQATDWHSLSSTETLDSLETAESGLTTPQVQERFAQYGLNSLPQSAKSSVLLRFLKHFHNLLIYVLLAAAAITMALGHWVDTGVILAVIVANALIGFLQEGKAEKSMDAIRHMLAPHANVMRDGTRQVIEGDHLVPGDIVLIEAGDKVPADLRMLKAHGLLAQEAVLTGESMPVEKGTDAVAQNISIGDRSSMAFSGTLVASGQGTGVVVATGARTEIGRVSGLLSEVQTITTPLVAQMAVFARWLTVLILLIAALIFTFGYFVEHYDFTDTFMAVVGFSVAAIPEGLPAVLTITLAIGVQAMAKRCVIVRHLPAIETLGSVSVICTDKTGTLTRNEMMVASVLDHQHLFTLGGVGYEPKGDLSLNDTQVSASEHAVLEELARAAVLCNDAMLHQEDGHWIVQGDPMEGALHAFGAKMDVEAQHEQSLWRRTDIIPFDAQYRYMATLNHDHDQHAFIFVKGAPEQILSMCESQRGDNQAVVSLDSAYWNDRIEKIAARGQRVLAFAAKPVQLDHTVLEHSDVNGSLILLGMVGMIDPPRLEAIAAVAQCHEAGIRVKMITGDHAKTAAAIGAQIGLQNTSKVLIGTELDAMDDGTLSQAVLNCDIFARTSPEHKLRLVMALQSNDLTVAMTGDGVNDAPALKRADAGIAMGRKGSEAAKEAAELVLVDDNFSSIAAAVREGRTVYDNLKKVISWTLPTNAGESLTIVVALLVGVTLPITAIQILWVNLVTAVTLGIALAFEPTEENTMRRPPRPRQEKLVTGNLVWHIVLVSVLFLCGVFGMYQSAIDRGYSVELARTIAVNTLVSMEIFHLFFIRNLYGTSLTWQAVRGTPAVWWAVCGVVAAQFAFTYAPPLQKVFSTAAVPFWDGVLIFGVGVVLFAIVETEKKIRLAFRRSPA